MNHNYYVPDFEVTPNPMPPNKSAAASASAALTTIDDNDEEDMMELLWQDGHVVFQSQNQRSHRKPNIIINGDTSMPPKHIPLEQQHQHTAAAANLFMQEDEMTTWLHYPLDDTPPPPPPFDHHRQNLYTNHFLYPPPPPPPPNSTPPSSLADHHHHHLKPPTAPVVLNNNNFTHFSRFRGITTHEQVAAPSISISNQTLMPSQVLQPPTPTVVDSSDTPAFAFASGQGKPPQSRISHLVSTSTSKTIGCPPTTALPPLGISSSTDIIGTCDFTVSSSPSGSAASDSVSVEPTTPKPSPPVMEDRKRKGRAPTADDGHGNQGIDVKKRARGSTTSTKKSRAAEVHNLSERKRRDRINEKMKALQELIPRCNKSDKASMLDEAIEYLKSLQLQVQMMSMGCTMVPMMFPGIQHYMPTVGMGMGMGIGPGMGMTRPMMQFPHVHPGSSVQGQSSTSHMAPIRFPTSAFPLPPPGAVIPDSNRIQATNLPDSMMNSSATQNLNHPQMQNVVVDPYQQYYLNTNQSRMSLFAQNPTVMQPNSSEPGGSGSSSNHRNLQSG